MQVSLRLAVYSLFFFFLIVIMCRNGTVQDKIEYKVWPSILFMFCGSGMEILQAATKFTVLDTKYEFTVFCIFLTYIYLVPSLTSIY